MQTQAVGTGASLASTSPSRGMDALQTEDFFRILVTELQNQDPLKPTETSDMIGQVSDIRNIEVSKQLADTLAQLTENQRTLGASELLGKFVTASIPAGASGMLNVGGVVTGVQFDASGAAILELDTGETILASQVNQIMSPETVEALLAQQDATADPGTDKTTESAKPRTGGFLAWLGDLLHL